MAIVNDSGGSERRPDRREKDDVYTPVHKTEDFREVVRRIKEKDDGRPITPSIAKKEEPKVTFNVPLPKGRGGIPTEIYKQQQEAKRETVRESVKKELYSYLDAHPGMTITNVNDYIEAETDMRLKAKDNKSTIHDSSTSRHASRVQGVQERKKVEEIRQQVIKTIGQPPPGVSKEKYNERVEQETQRLVDIIKRPRYVYLADGTPYYLNKEDERAELEKSLMDESPLKRLWTLAKYDVATGVEKLTRFIDEGSQTAKEIITDTNSKGNVFGGIMQLGLNSAMLGFEYLKFGDYPILASKEKAEQLRQEAAAVKFTDPAAADVLLQKAQDMDKGVALKEEYNTRLKIAGEAVDRAWSTLFTEIKESNEFATEHYDPNMVDPKTGRKISPMEQQIMYEHKKEEEAKTNAASIRVQAEQAYAQGDYEKAIQLTKDAIEQDKLASGRDAYGAYTWMRQPESYEKFKEDAALLELQKGAPLTKEEIRRLKEYHANGWTELTGELAFDPTNLIPAAVLDTVLKVPFKTVLKANKAVAEAVPLYGKTLNVLGSPVRWLTRQSVEAGATKIARKTNNVFQRVSNAYTSSEDVVKAIDEISDAVSEARRAVNEGDARAIFEQARKNTPGLQQITFQDFKGLMDAGEHVDPTTWGKMYSDALQGAEQGLIDSAKTLNKNVDDVVSDFSKKRWALEEIADKFSDAFIDPHRIYKGSRLTDDTIAGWVTGTMRRLSGDEINEALKVHKFDEWANSVKLGDNAKRATQAATHFLEASLGFAANVRDLWATMVLTTFRWPINNMVDTTMRSVVYGGKNSWDDLRTLFTSTQRTLADELGFAPLEFNTALARKGVPFVQQVPHKLLYEGWKPRLGVFSFVTDEYRRLMIAKKGSKDAARLVKEEVLTKMFDGMQDSALKRALVTLADGMNYKVNLGTALRTMPGAIQDMNTAIEFTFRLRMFHREYFKLLEKLEPKFIERGMEALSPSTKEIAKQIWKAAEGNPRKMTAYVDNLLGGSKNTPASWSFVVPPEMDDILKDMDLADQNLFISSVKDELDAFVDTAARNGQELKRDDFKKFFEDYKLKMQDEVQHRISLAQDHRDMGGSIRTDGQANPVPTEDDIRGSLPIPKDESPRNKQIEDAIGKLNRKKRRAPLDIHKDFEAAISDYAKVERVAGDGMRVVRRDGQTVIEVGDNLLKKNAKAYYSGINDAVINILKNHDVDLITHGGFANVDQYETVMRKFFDDPTAVLNDNERQFLTLVNQMENHPNLRRIIEQTSPETVRKYDSALDVYRDIGEYSDVYGFNKRPDRLMMSEAEKIRPMPGSHVAAANDARLANRQLLDLSKSVSPEIEDTVREFVGQLQVYRQELKQFYSFTYPGPLMRATTEGGRHAGWDLFYRLSEAEFKREAEISNKLIELLKTDPEAATKMLAEANDNFAEFFLKENGIELEWDIDRQMIMNVKVRGLDGKMKNFTARRDIANLQVRFFSPKTRAAIEGTLPVRLGKDPKLTMHLQLRDALRSTFQTDTAHAEAWAKVIGNHAEKWAQETGQPIEKYYERLGFQRVDSASAKGLGTLEQTRVVKRGAIKRNDDGTFMFFGLSHSNFESMVRETSELFFDDLVSMAEHSPQAADDLANIKKFLEEKTGKKIRANRLDQVHSDILSDTFSSYIATGHGPDIKIKNGFGRLKKWLNTTFDAVRDSKVAGEIPDDTYRVLDRLFVEAQLFDVPQTNARAIRLMAREAELVTDSEDDLLKIINEALAQPNLTPEQTTARQALEETLRVKNDELTALNERINDADDAMRQAFMVAHGSDLRFAQDELTEAQKALDEFDAGIPKNTQTYETLGDVPKDVAARLLGTPEKPLESKIANEIQEGWEVWRTQRSLKGFPDEALTDPDTFKAHLKQRMGEEWGELEHEYNRLLWEVEQFEDAMLNYHAGDDLRTTLFPRVHEAQMSDGMRTFIRNRETLRQSHDIGMRALDNWSEYMGKLADEGHPAPMLTKEEQAALKAWAYGDGTKAKAELVSTLLNGSDEVEGAIPLVQKRMLDYENTNVLDKFMKNWFPFWMFPSRSLPFWAETMATHPSLIANYEKVQRLSRSQRYQAGAVTSRGKPLPSLDGYIQIPGTDTWFNPLAPLSFRYVLDIQKSRDDILYAAQSEDDVDPKTFMASEMMNMGQVYGFSLAPWAAMLMKGKLGIPDEIIPRYPLIPEIQLFPRWWVQEQAQRATQMNLFGMDWDKHLNNIYPEVPWHDYMVERRILEDALQKLQSGSLTQEQKNKIMQQAQNALKHKDTDALWAQTYQAITRDEATQSRKSFFSGMYTKNFGDGEADLLALRNELNMLKSALNNEFQATVFDLPTDAETGWDNYLSKMDSPEGWVHRLYTDIGWVKNGEGELVRDPQERAIWLAKKIEMDEDQQMYYDKMADLQKKLQSELRSLPVGADWELVRGVFDRYAEGSESLDYLRTFERVYGTNKPTELIQKDIANDWFRKLKGTKPNWNVEGGETYDEYQQRVVEWETNLPKIAAVYMRAYSRRTDLNKTLGALHEDQQFNTGEFFNQLVTMSNTEGLEMYEKENDDVFDAMNKAWKATYWDEYWNSVIGKDGYEVDLAEQDFYNNHNQPPSTDELYQWIATYYGPEKFTRDEIAKWAEGGDTLSVEERQLQGKDDPADFKKRQEIWDMLSWIGPGNKNRGVFETAFANAGGDPDWLTTWYQESGEAYKARNTERLDQLHDSIQQAVSALGLKQPERAELVRYIQAQKENDMFKQLVHSELGNQFFDYEDDDGTMQQGVFSYYNSLSYDDRKEFRSSYPDEYDAIQSYYDMKETFQDEHLTWADYYGFETEPSVSLPTNESGSTMTPPALRGSGGKPRSGGGGRGSGKPEARPTYTPYGSDRIPYFNISDRTSNYISPGLYGLVGNKMAWEITNLMSSGRRISSGGVSFLRSIASRYPQYRSEIDNLLAKGS